MEQNNNLNYEKAIQAVLVQNIRTTETTIEVNTQIIAKEIMEYIITPHINKVAVVAISTAEKEFASVAKTVFESLAATGTKFNKNNICITLDQLVKSREEQRNKANFSKEESLQENVDINNDLQQEQEVDNEEQKEV